MSKRNRNCTWHCGRETKNISRICDYCWAAAELLRSNRDEGFRAWAECKRAQQAKETEAKPKKPMSEKQRAALDKARRAKLLKQLPTSELSAPVDSQTRATLENPFIANTAERKPWSWTPSIPVWQGLQKATLDRDGRRCVVCGARSGLTAHHIIPRSEGGEDELRNLATLCRVCHDKVEEMDEFGWRWIQSQRARDN